MKSVIFKKYGCKVIKKKKKEEERTSLGVL
jgi:hypothetical protein